MAHETRTTNLGAKDLSFVDEEKELVCDGLEKKESSDAQRN